jgi:hypothetical protein
VKFYSNTYICDLMKRILSLLLLLVFCVILSPKELLHDLHHSDSIDTKNPSDKGFYIGLKHHHCTILQVASPLLYHSILLFALFFFAVYTFFNALYSSFICEKLSDLNYLRGPPFISNFTL